MKRILIFIFLTMNITLIASEYSTGVRLFMRKNPDKAKEHFLAAVEEDSTNGNAYYYLGEIEKNNRNYKQAIDYYIKALDNRLSGKYQKLTHWNLIILTEQINDLDGMVKTCKIMYEKRGDHAAKKKVDELINKMLWTNNQSAIDAYKSGKSNHSSGNTQNALDDFKSALSYDNSFLAPRFEIGIINYKNGNVGEALRNLRVIANKIPYYTAVQTLAAKISMDNKQYSDATTYYSNILKYGFINTNTRLNTLSQRASCHIMTGRYTEAEQDIQNALQIRESINLKKMLSAVYIKQNRFEKASIILADLDKRSPSNADIKYQLGSLYYKASDEKWVKTFGALFNLTNKNKTLSKKYSKAYLLLANHYFSQKEYNRSTHIYQAITTEMLEFKDKNQAAHSFFQTKNYKEAIELFESISLAQPEKLLLAKAYLKTGHESKARNSIEYIVLHTSAKQAIVEDPDLGPLAKKIIQEDMDAKEELRKAEEAAAKKRELEEKVKTDETKK